jgi:hypothetical protein
MADNVTSDYALARWAYSELLSPTQRENYEQLGGLPSTIWDWKTLGVPFDDLELQQRALLRAAWQNVRGNGTIFGAAVDGVANFQLAHWSTDELADAYVIPMFADEATLDAKKPLTFQRWLETSPKRPLHPHHAWHAEDAPSTPHRHNQDPALAGRVHLVTALGPMDRPSLMYCSAAYMLLDGYHRAAQFWKRGEPSTTLAVYVPSQIE